MTNNKQRTNARCQPTTGRMNRRGVIRAAAGAAGLGFAGQLGTTTAGARAAAAQTPAAAACGDAPVTISYGIWDLAQKPGVDAQIAAFNQKFPNISVTVEVIPWDDFWTKLQTGVGGGQSYDTFWMTATYFPVYASQGSLEPLTATIDAGAIDTAAYPESLLQLFTLDDAVYGIPRDFDTIALAYNKDLFDAAGVAYPTGEWTWDDLRAAAEQLTVRDGDQVTQWGYGCAVEDQQNYSNFIYQNEGEMLSADRTESMLAEQPACDALMYLTGFVTDELSPTPADFQANPPYETLFPAGVIAMVPAGSWNMKTFHEVNPAIAVAPLPRGKQQACVIQGLANVIWSGSPNKCAATEWIKFLASEEAELILGDTGTVIPAMNGTQDAWIASIPELDLQVYLDAVTYSVPFPISVAGTEWRDKVSEVLTAAWNGELPADQICARAAEAANAVL